MNIATITLKKLQSDNVMVDIFTDHFNQSLYGFIRKFNDDYLLLEHYNDDGFYNGIIVLQREDITRIKWGNNDLNNVHKIINKHDQEKSINAIKIDSLESILKSVYKAYKHVNLQIQNIDSGMCIIGEIEEMDSESLVIHEFGTRSSLDRGRTILSLADITRIDAGGMYELGLLKVHKKQK